MSRFDHVEYDDKSKSFNSSLQTHLSIVEQFVNALPEGRAKAVAFTKLEEFGMWMGKAIRDTQISRNQRG